MSGIEERRQKLRAGRLTMLTGFPVFSRRWDPDEGLPDLSGKVRQPTLLLFLRLPNLKNEGLGCTGHRRECWARSRDMRAPAEAQHRESLPRRTVKRARREGDRRSTSARQSSAH